MSGVSILIVARYLEREREREREAFFQSQGRLSSHEVNDHWEGLPA